MLIELKNTSDIEKVRKWIIIFIIHSAIIISPLGNARMQSVKVILNLFSENPDMYDRVAVVSFYPYILYKVSTGTHCAHVQQEHKHNVMKLWQGKLSL